MKKILNIAVTLSALIYVMFMMSFAVQAETFDGIVYELNYDDNGEQVAVITGYEGTEEIINIPSDINGWKVVAIGDNAFSGSTSEHISLPETVTSIGNNAFNGCARLMQINIPSSVKTIGSYAFSACTSLTEIAIPEGVTYISEGTFSGCHDLNRITIPYSVTAAGENAFYGCSYLNEIYYTGNYSMRWSIMIESGNEYLEQASWRYDDTLEYIDSCGENAICKIYNDGRTVISGTGYINNFNYAVSSLIIADGITGISENAFRDCQSLTDISIPSSVEYIGENAFAGCENIGKVTVDNLKYWYTNVDIHSSPLIYGAYLYDCNGLVTEIKISAEEWNVNYIAFAGCASIESINVEEENEIFSSQDGILYNYDKTDLLIYPAGKSDETFTVSEAVMGIFDFAFSGSSLSEIKTHILTDFRCFKNLRSVVLTGDYEIDFYYNFSECTGLGDITVSNSYYESVGGVVLSKDKKQLIFCPRGKGAVYEIPDGVTEIYANAFGGCYNLTEITLPDSIVKIGDYAFSSCYIEKVHIESIEAWCNISFESESSNPLGCLYINGEKIEDVTIPDSVSDIGNYAFCLYEELSSVTIPKGVKTIGDGAFYGCKKLENIVFPESLETIGESAFSNCNSVSEIAIPKNVSFIGNAAFFIDSLTEINVDAENKNYSSDSGVLFDKDKTTLIYFPKQKGAEYTVPNGVTTIKSIAFSGNSILKKITVPDSLKIVEPQAFYLCSNLKDVYFTGSKTDWSDITIEGYNSKFTDATRHYILMITYNMGGFTTVPESQMAENGEPVTLSSEAPERLYYSLKGWATSPDSQKVEYQLGETITMGNENLTLYAVWERTSYTKTVKLEQENGDVFVVVPYGVEENVDVILACYNGKKLVKYETLKRGANSMVVFIADTDLEYDTAKILVWENNSLTPLTEAENVE